MKTKKTNKAEKVKVPSGGLKGVVDLLNLLDPNAKNKIISEMEKKDPGTTQIIKNNLLSIDDLKYVSASMIRELLKEISIKELSLALKLAKPETLEHICQNVSKNSAQEIKELILSIPVRKSVAIEALQKVMDSFLKKVDAGLIVLDKGGKDKMV
jgi:flagellar motor switch protein FliG